MRKRTATAGLIATVLGLLLSTAAAPPPTPAFRDADLPADARIANLLSLMTVDEKIDALSTDSSVPRLGVPSFGSSEGIHGVQQRGEGKDRRTPILTTQFP
jgi:beta-glucosidase